MSSAGESPRSDDAPRPDQRFPAEGHPPRPPQGYGPGPSPYDDPPHVYNPYGNVSYPSSYPVPPAGLGSDDALPPARRPGSVTLALVLLLVSALPYLLVGTLFLLATGVTPDMLPPEQRAQLDQLGVDAAQVFRLVGILGGVMLALALAFMVFAVLAWTGRKWARALVAAMTVGLVLLVLVALLGGAAQGAPLDPASLFVVGGPAALAVAGVALLFGRAARDWFARPRRPARS